MSLEQRMATYSVGQSGKQEVSDACATSVDNPKQFILLFIDYNALPHKSLHILHCAKLTAWIREWAVSFSHQWTAEHKGP